MSDNTVRLKIKIEGAEGFKTVETNADELRGAIERVKNEADKVNASLLNANQLAQTFDQVKSAVQGLQSAMHSLTDAYSVQAAAEARLETVMRNTMDASEAEIQSIKDLAAAQQQLGIVGDEVQLTGAQELASYLSKKESLETLIPVMNDMIAQQYGYNASAESAAQIASMMGKVMEGQVKALSRYGYSFTEAQEEILKFGTEEERAATLADVISQSVGGVNQAMAATPYGKIVQANNKFGDLKETLGSMIAPAMTVVDNIARVSIAVAGLGKGIATVKSLGASIRALGIHSKVTAAAQRMLGAAGITAAAGTTALRVAVTALYATMTLGLSLAIQGVITLITRLASSTKDAAEETEELTAAEEAQKRAMGDARGEIQNEIAELEMLMATNSDTTAAVEKLNEKYGEAFGYYNTAAQWYQVLIGKSEAYCRQLGYEAKAKQMSAEIGAMITERDEKQERLEQLKSELPNYEEIQREQRQRLSDMGVDPSRVNVMAVSEDPDIQKKEHEAYELSQEVNDLDDEIRKMLGDLQDVQGKAIDAGNALRSAGEDGVASVSWQEMSYSDLGKAIEEQKKKVGSFSDANSAEAQNEIALLQSMKLRYDALGRTLGLVSSTTREVTQDLQRMAVDLIPTLEPRGLAQLAVPEESVSLKPSVTGFQNLEQINRRLQDLQQQRLKASKDEIPVIDAQISYVERLRDEFEGISKAKMPDISQAWSGIKGVGNSIRDIKDALTETDDAWDALTQTIDGFISLFQSITSVIEIIKNISAATKAMAATKTEASTQVAAANSLEATTNTAVAATGAASAMANIPWVGPALAIAAVASILAALANLPKFAGGGIIYGPTVGLMGEYAGASNNPEVVAPLSKLQGMLGGGGGPTEIKFRIQGRELVGIYNKQTNIYNRSK